jgi:sigma-B regulation protein RsbQ
MVFANGIGCDQNMWLFVAPAFEGSFRTILFDNVGAGGADLNANLEPRELSSEARLRRGEPNPAGGFERYAF